MRRSVRAAAVAACLVVVVLLLGATVAPPPDVPPPQSPSGAWEALTHWTASRAFPADDLPAAGYTAAYAVAKRLPEAPDAGTPDKTTLQGWRQLGPHNFGGRTLAIAFNPLNPRTIWAGTASGGLWRTTTGGRGPHAWEQVRTWHPVLGVASVAVAPNDSNLIFIGTGEVYQDGNSTGGVTQRFARGSYGIGILRSRDGGRRWANCLDWSADQRRGVQVVRIDPSDPRIVWAGTTEGTYKSTDGGDTWRQVHAMRMVEDLVVSSADPARVVIACGNFATAGCGLYRTTDGGDTWTKCVEPGVLPAYFAGKAQLASCAGAPDVILASVGNGDVSSPATWLCRSEDGGATWSLASTQDYSQWQGWFAHDVAVKPDDPSVVITAGIDVWKSTTGGTALVAKSDWTAWYFGQTQPGEPEGPPYYVHADVHDVVFHPTDPNTVYFATDGGVFRSLDAGETFEGCNGGFQTQQFYAGFVCSARDSFHALGGMQDNATAIYAGSDAWIRVVGGDGGWAVIDPAHDDVLFACSQYLNVFSSSNRGVTWVSAPPPYDSVTGFIAPLAAGGAAPPHAMYGGRRVIYRWLIGAGGAGWSPTNYGYYLDGNPALAIAVSPRDGNVVYVATAPVGYPAGFYTTRDGGNGWTRRAAGLPNRYLPGIAIDPVDDRIVYVTASGFGTSHLFKTTDGGANWRDVGAGLPDAPTSCVAIDPCYRDHVFVGNDLGVFRSDDGGDHWLAWNLGLPDAVIAMDLKVSASNRALRLATHGNGVYERSLESIPTGVPDTASGPPLRLGPAAPNPFNPVTTIAYELLAPGEVELSVYDVRGRLVRTLRHGAEGTGQNHARWDGRDERGAAAASGVYLCRLRAGGVEQTLRLVLAR